VVDLVNAGLKTEQASSMSLKAEEEEEENDDDENK
jgi:hypothetical protein